VEVITVEESSALLSRGRRIRLGAHSDRGQHFNSRSQNQQKSPRPSMPAYRGPAGKLPRAKARSGARRLSFPLRELPW
jgi:hypothetical protein